MITGDVMRKAQQLAKHQLGLPHEQAFCDHDWEPQASPQTLEGAERRCSKCKLLQRAEVFWRDVKED